jgi:hypothetical protein
MGRAQAKAPTRAIVYKIAATTDPTHSCRQREYLGSYKASTMKSAHSIYLGIIKAQLFKIKSGGFSRLRPPRVTWHLGCDLYHVPRKGKSHVMGPCIAYRA